METKLERESFVRWQEITINQLTYAVGLILSLSTASLGFAISLLTNKDFEPSLWGKRFFLLTIATFLISTGLGVWCVINRLVDFRVSRKIAKQREKNASDEELSSIRLKSKSYGDRTWTLFWWQIGVFAFAVLSFIACVLTVYQQKLF
jgi:hypothetical protein